MINKRVEHRIERNRLIVEGLCNPATSSKPTFSVRKEIRQPSSRNPIDEFGAPGRIQMQTQNPPPPMATRQDSGGAGTLQSRNQEAQAIPLHPEIRLLVQLQLAHAHKVYFSVRKNERMPDGQRPTKDGGWNDVWAQLDGTTLSVWDMKAITEASKKGEEVPPSYINVTNAVSIYINLQLLLWYC